MPKDSLSLYFTIQTSGLDGLTSLTEKTKALDKDTQQLAQAAIDLKTANSTLTKSQQELQMQLEESSKKVQEARKAFKANADETSKLNLSHAIQEQTKLKNSLKLVKDELNSNEKQFKEYVNRIEDSARSFDEMSIDDAISESLGLEEAEAQFRALANASDEAHMSIQALQEDARKADLQDVGDSGDSYGIDDLAEGAVISKLGGDLGRALGGAFGSLASSMVGDQNAQLVSGILSGALSGGATGAILGPLGIAAGAGIGALTGGISGITQIATAQDDSFKEYYNNLYDQFDATEGLSGGSDTAAGREMDLISLSTMFGSEDAATGYLKQLVDMANMTPFLYDDLMGMSKTLATYGYDETNILPVLQNIGDTGAALGQSTSDMTAVATALGRMKSSDKTTLEYLNILNDRGINAVGWLAEARGKTVAETYDDISHSKIKGTDAVEIILQRMEEAYAGSMEAQSKTFSGKSSTLEGLQQEVQNAGGESYNTLRNEGMQEEIDSLSGELGDAMKEMQSIIGENQAYLENLSEQYQRDALNTMFYGAQSDLFKPEEQETLNEKHEGYLELKEAYENGDQEAGLKLQELYEEVQETAQAYYESSSAMQTKEDAELEHLAAIRENTANLASTQYGYREDQEASKGGAATEDFKSSLRNSFNMSWNSIINRDSYTPVGAAYGLNRVPYNNYPMLLHEGERVLTASQARQMDKSMSAHSFAFGLTRAPHDDYPALLHEGERVLDSGTADELSLLSSASEGDNGEMAELLRGLMMPVQMAVPEVQPLSEASGGGAPITITVTGNSFTGTDEDMADRIADMIALRLEQAAVIHQPR